MPDRRILASLFSLPLALAACHQDGNDKPTPVASASTAPAAKASALASPSASASSAASTRAPDQLAPLSPALKQKLASIRRDPPPPELTKGRHYLVSNEQRPYYWQRCCSNLGGIAVGVGTEQNFLIAGWARPEVMILMDFDQWVVWLNELHVMFFDMAKDPDELFTLWTEPSIERVKAAIDRRFGERAPKMREVFAHGRLVVERRLTFMRHQLERYHTPSAFTDAEPFGHVQKLVRAGRVHAVRGDQLGEAALTDVAAFARAAKLPVRTFYTSNAEDYFPYFKGNFRKNIAALPFDDRSLVLHTMARERIHYWYVYQSGENYQRWVASEAVLNFGELFKKTTLATIPDAKEKSGRTFLRTLTEEPPGGPGSSADPAASAAPSPSAGSAP